MTDGVIVLAAVPVLAATSYGIWVAIDEVRKWRMRRAFRADNGPASVASESPKNGSGSQDGES